MRPYGGPWGYVEPVYDVVPQVSARDAVQNAFVVHSPTGGLRVTVAADDIARLAAEGDAVAIGVLGHTYSDVASALADAHTTFRFAQVAVS